MNNVLELLYDTTDLFPTKIALEDEKKSITYQDFLKSTRIIASVIVNQFSGETQRPIVVFIDRNIESIISFFGVIHSGNYYVPIDVNQPEKRIDLILEDLKPLAIINATNEEKVGNLNVLKYSEIIKTGAQSDKIDMIKNQIIDTDPLYAMFTSGSTGRPKGVLISHRSILDLVVQFTKEFEFTSGDVFGNQAPFDFDVSSKDIYNSIAVGAKISIIPKRVFSFPNQLINYLNTREINIGIWATSVLRIIENFKGFEQETPKTLTKVMFSGEVMPNKVLNYWRKHLPKTEFINLYGPTEITCNCTFYRVKKSYKDSEPLPIGKAFDNTRILLLNDKDEESSKGEIGEICVVGSSLALGYLNNEEETQKSFVQNPLNKLYPETIYRTGDLGKYNNSGDLMFISRKDHQIKHMGHRIELSEIETLISSFNYIDGCCCLYDENKEKIILFYESEIESKKKIFKDAMEVMPKYMIPNKMIHFKKLPLNNNSKIDRALLKSEFIDEEN